jgi:UDP-GlcNAc3NAcA epimerase
MTQIVTIVGARPQFVKAAVVSRVIDEWNAANPDAPVNEMLVHTGQHYDRNMSQVFFDELDIREPAVNLEIGSGRHGEMTARMLSSIEDLLIREQPDWVLVYGDTNSTLAGALAAAKLHIPIAHVEAGLRSFNRRMPEEINRVLVDHVAAVLFCPTETAVRNLRREGIVEGVENVGDVMLDASLYYRQVARQKSDILNRLGLAEGGYALATCHRAENTNDPVRLRRILQALAEVSRAMPVILPLHPRTRSTVADRSMESLLSGITVIEPVPFIDMIRLEESARVIVTDSGGVQKEAYFFKVPCVTLRDETEWVETVETGWNRVVGADHERIVAGALEACPQAQWPPLYGDGKAGAKILQRLLQAPR